MRSKDWHSKCPTSLGVLQPGGRNSQQATAAASQAKQQTLGELQEEEAAKETAADARLRRPRVSETSEEAILLFIGLGSAATLFGFFLAGKINKKTRRRR